MSFLGAEPRVRGSFRRDLANSQQAEGNTRWAWILSLSLGQHTQPVILLTHSYFQCLVQAPSPDDGISPSCANSAYSFSILPYCSSFVPKIKMIDQIRMITLDDQVRQDQTKANYAGDWHIYSYLSSQWTTFCTGLVMVNYH